ncbi:hypothetical protein HPP92_009693 [Vanilla planifolia]|uniref:Uncharacterized protein n=1 Tax=Vanilla planifolia TaxID=51239 RepID=A0A835R711_VANPL|nr:hypothetical protein HPP92_009693 [Vanilla planifolia]
MHEHSPSSTAKEAWGDKTDWGRNEMHIGRLTDIRAQKEPSGSFSSPSAAAGSASAIVVGTGNHLRSGRGCCSPSFALLAFYGRRIPFFGFTPGGN